MIIILTVIATTLATTINTKNSNNKCIGHIVIPYMQGIGGSFKNICGKYWIQIYFMDNSTIKNIQVSPMEKTQWNKKG